MHSPQLVAYHESGHAIAALYNLGAFPIHNVTIRPQHPSLGMLTQVSSKRGAYISKEESLARLDVCFAGIVAEKLIFGEDNVTSGAKDDLRVARELAEKMVTVSSTGKYFFCFIYEVA